MSNFLYSSFEDIPYDFKSLYIFDGPNNSKIYAALPEKASHLEKTQFNTDVSALEKKQRIKRSGQFPEAYHFLLGNKLAPKNKAETPEWMPDLKGNWTKEIVDDTAIFVPPKKHGTYKISDIYKDSKVYKLFPELGQKKVDIKPENFLTKLLGIAGTNNIFTGNHALYTNEDYGIKDMLEYALSHELQHGLDMKQESKLQLALDKLATILRGRSPKTGPLAEQRAYQMDDRRGVNPMRYRQPLGN